MLFRSRLPAYSNLGNVVGAYLGRYEGLSWEVQCYGIQSRAPDGSVVSGSSQLGSLANSPARVPRQVRPGGQPGNGQEAAAAAAAAPPHRHFVLLITHSRLPQSHIQARELSADLLHVAPRARIVFLGPCLPSSFLVASWSLAVVHNCMRRFSRWPKRHARESAMVRPVSRSPSLLIFAPHRVCAKRITLRSALWLLPLPSCVTSSVSRNCRARPRTHPGATRAP